MAAALILILAWQAAALTPPEGAAGRSRRLRPQTVRLSADALRKRAVTCKAPAYPLGGHLRMESPVTVEILVDESGRVRSAKAVSGHPLLQMSAVQAARWWTFRPVKVSGKAVKVAGTLTLRFSRDAAEMERQCDGLNRVP